MTEHITACAVLLLVLVIVALAAWNDLRSRSRFWSDALVVVVGSLAAAMLIGCGGTSDEDDKHVRLDPPDCAASAAPCR